MGRGEKEGIGVREGKGIRKVTQFIFLAKSTCVSSIKSCAVAVSAERRIIYRCSLNIHYFQMYKVCFCDANALNVNVVVAVVG